jgi:Arc/MetJ-type ribon-helix-helix transcriptional regulator
MRIATYSTKYFVYLEVRRHSTLCFLERRERIMETVQIQLPPPLVQRIRQEISSDEALSQVVAEAIQMWLERRREEKVEKEKVLQTLRQAGVVIASERQRALAEAMMATLPIEKAPTRAQVEASLAKLRVPLSAEIIAMRGKR